MKPRIMIPDTERDKLLLQITDILSRFKHIDNSTTFTDKEKQKHFLNLWWEIREINNTIEESETYDLIPDDLALLLDFAYQKINKEETRLRNMKFNSEMKKASNQ